MTMHDLDDLRDELSEFAQPKREGKLTPRQERLIADFAEILDFADEHGHAPGDTPTADVTERIYYLRLQRMAQTPEAVELLKPFDKLGLLEHPVETSEPDITALSEALTELSMDDELTQLVNVRPHHTRQVPEDVADRRQCADFEVFEPLFKQIRQGLKTGLCTTQPFGQNASIQQADFFILDGQILYVAEEGEKEFRTKAQRADRRLRVIYDNGTESNILMRSLQRALYKDKTSRRIIIVNEGPLFGSLKENGDTHTGTIYVVRSQSEHPLVKEYGDLLHKIGVTCGDVHKRLANAQDDPTFLLADVKLVASWELANIHPFRLEHIIHQVFSPAQIDIEIKDRFGKPYHPKEWFLVPLFVIEEAVKRISDGSITEYIYDPQTAQLKKQPKPQ